MPSYKNLTKDQLSKDFTALSAQLSERQGESEATLKSYYNSSPVLMGTVELTEDDILHVYDNPATCRFFRLEAESTAGRLASELGVPPAAIREWMRHYRECQSQGKPVQFEYVHDTPGSPRWLSATVWLIGPAPSGRLRFCYVAEDITERKRAEAALRESEELLRFALNAASVGAWDWNILTNEVRWSENLGAIHGLAPGMFNGTFNGFLQDVHPDDREKVLQVITRAIEGSGDYYVEYRHIRPDGSMSWMEGKGQVVYDNAHRPVRMIGVCMDITERKRVEEALFEEKERAQITLGSIGDGVITIDTTGRVASLNRVAEQLTGWRSTEAQGLPLPQVFKIISETTREPVEDPLQRYLCEGKIIGLGHHTALIRRDGQELCIDDSAAPIRDRGGSIVGVVVVFRDVTEQRRLIQQVSYQATHDALTGLVNRPEFERRLELMLKHAKEQHQQHALCYLDLDQFKVVNDTCGHVVGDTLLRQLAALLKTRVRERDTLARLGGDEFGVLLGECSLDQALRIANQLRESIQNFRFAWENKLFSLGVSIGLIPITELSSDLPSILSAADSACYVAKEKGRNRVHVYQPGDNELEQRQGEMQWINRLHEALANDHFRLYFQPIVPIGQIVSEDIYGEILLRLLDQEGQIMLPGTFIPAAERYGQMQAIDRWVIRTVLHSPARGFPPMRYAINVSGQSLGHEEFLNFVTEQLDQADIAPGQICFEITETAAIANLPAAMSFISTLKARGCSFALDDFGSGLSSFAYLKTMPVDYLKINGGFIKDMERDPMDRAMVEAIHRIGHVMGLKTIAESVEDKATLEVLRAIGVDYAQGSGIAQPRPLELI